MGAPDLQGLMADWQGWMPDWQGWMPDWHGLMPDWEGVLPDWQGWIRSWPESFEAEAAAGAERIVSGDGFAQLLAHMTENAVAVSRISADMWDLVVRNLRLAGRADIDRLARQLAASEDKLERILQAIEPLQDERAET